MYIYMYNLCGNLFCCLQLLHDSFGKQRLRFPLLFSISALMILRRRVDRKHEIKLEIETAMPLPVDRGLSWQYMYVCRERSMIRPGRRIDLVRALHIKLKPRAQFGNFCCTVHTRIAYGYKNSGCSARCDKAKALGNAKNAQKAEQTLRATITA